MENKFKEKPKAEEQEKPKIPVKESKVVRSVANVVSGSFLSKETTVKKLPFIFFLSFLAVCYIAKGYYDDDQVRKLNRLTNELKELQTQYIVVKDSLVIKKDVVLEDVIVKSPIIKIEDHFKGNLQVFATKKIDVGANVTLSYPSVLSIYNNSDAESQIVVNENSAIYGAVVLFGTKLMNTDDNKVVFKENTKVIGDIYCTGKLMISGKVFGAVFANRVFSQTQSATYENCIINAEIDITKRPDYFVSIPLFKNQKEVYGIFKKVL